MVRKGDYKLIYYPEGNHVHLFNVTDDPEETRNLAHDPEATAAKTELLEILKGNLYGGDENWVKDGELVGLPERHFEPAGDVGLRGQRGLRFM
jgi:arylsulfatase A-like enzyme